MKKIPYIDVYRDQTLLKDISSRIHAISKKEVQFMEVCGGHTMAIHQFGIRQMLPPTIKLLSGPGCPVCVTSRIYIDKAIRIGQMKDVIITTYGDLIRVPGSSSSLERERGNGMDVRMVYSAMDAVVIARENPTRQVVFLGIGFETTAPASAITIIEAKKSGLVNFSLLSAHKVMPPVMQQLIHEGIRINGYIAPGHVSAITGTRMYQPIVENFHIPVVVSGFEAADILHSILLLVRQVESGTPRVEVQYKRVVKSEGNTIAQERMRQVFSPADEPWRGFGVIPESGLRIRKAFSTFDADLRFPLKMKESPEPKGCICGNILKGLQAPADCRLFAKKCTPDDPVGACMVSSEGACAAAYKYAT